MSLQTEFTQARGVTVQLYLSQLMFSKRPAASSGYKLANKIPYSEQGLAKDT